MGLDAIGIVSKNIPRSVKFYEIFGIDLREIAPDHWEGTTTGGVRLMLDSAALVKQLNPGWQEPSGCGVVLCFKQNSPQDVDAVYSRVTKAGFKSVKAPWDAFWGQRYASVLGPDGNQVDIFAAL